MMMMMMMMKSESQTYAVNQSLCRLENAGIEEVECRWGW